MTSTEIILPNWLRKIGMWFTGGTFYYAFVWAYDYLFFTFILWKFGLIWGSAIIIATSFLLDLATMKFYDYLKKDWLAIETIKQAGLDQKNWFGKLVNWLLNKKGKFFVFVLLSIKFNPFLVTAYMRKGANTYDGLTSRDWFIFLASTIFANMYWILIVFGGLSIFTHVFQSIANYIYG
ncbi:MAG: hypothetical protein ACD_72C00042G0002 [uncultured bacterium]|nr:MAG: hypothetical protein ACD_72C00042G0002 [uncultured bacterium]